MSNKYILVIVYSKDNRNNTVSFITPYSTIPEALQDFKNWCNHTKNHLQLQILEHSFRGLQVYPILNSPE